MFLKSVDASDKVKDSHFLFQLLDEVLEGLGVANVVQIITNNASNYVLAGKMLEGKYKTIFWIPCVAHCMDLMLEDIGKIDWVKNTIEHAKSITKYIYNHSWILSLTRKHTRGRDIIRLAITRFATHFLTVQSMQRVFSNDEWNECQWFRKQDGKDVKKKGNEEIFWKRAAEPLVKVLRLVDGEILVMGFIYEAMDQVKEQIKAIYKDRVAKYGPIWEIIDQIWNNQLHCPIHAIGFFLNPRYHYKALEVEALTGEVRDGLIDYIDCMVPKESDPLVIHRQITCFNRATGIFGRNLGRIAREADEPEALVEHIVQLNVDPLVPGPVPRTLVAVTSSTQPWRKHISCLSQCAIVVPASATTSTVVVGDGDEEEPWVSLFDFDSKSEPDDVGFSSSSQ
eukprot:PITA_06209